MHWRLERRSSRSMPSDNCVGPDDLFALQRQRSFDLTEPLCIAKYAEKMALQLIERGDGCYILRFLRYREV